MAECIQIAFLNMKTFFQCRLFSTPEANKDRPAAKSCLASSIIHLLSVIAFLACTDAAFSQSTDYAAGKASAEKFYSEGSYAKAREVYSKIDISTLPNEDTRWVQFRLADTQWRSAAATGMGNTSELDAARDMTGFGLKSKNRLRISIGEPKTPIGTRHGRIIRRRWIGGRGRAI